MAYELKSYVEKFLLNPGASFNVDDEGNEETSAQIIESLAVDEGVDEQQQSRSKLRARSEALLQETDSRYRGKKVSRKDLKKDVSFDPELTKFFAVESDGAASDDETQEINQAPVREKKSLGLETENGLDDEEEDEDEEDDEEETDDIDQEEKESVDEEQHIQDDGLVFDGDFSKFAEDIEEGSDEVSDGEDEGEEDDDEEGEEEEEAAEEKETPEKSKKSLGVSLKKFLSGDEEEEIQKSQCVKRQLGLFDNLFEMRIGMQKGVAGANQLPQFNTYKSFLQEKDPNYMKNLASAKSSAKKLLSTLLEAQLLLLNQNPETSHLMSGNRKHADAESSDEEITSSEGEAEKVEKVSQNQGTKRKLKLGEYGEVLSKRHAALLPFRDETLTRWYEKTKLLSSSRGRDKFSGFEVSALQQLNNILNNKPQLIRRTQLTGVTRGTTYHVLGSNDENVTEAEREEYDPEIFDDSDFYSRALEEMLKSKIALSDDMSDVSRKWIEIQKLRKKAKRKVDTKASKGRKLRYEVISKLQQYLAPCYPPQMDDAAINTLFASLFGKGIQVNKCGNV